jgi:hypothetical protein
MQDERAQGRRSHVLDRPTEHPSLPSARVCRKGIGNRHGEGHELSSPKAAFEQLRRTGLRNADQVGILDRGGGEALPGAVWPDEDRCRLQRELDHAPVGVALSALRSRLLVIEDHVVDRSAVQ